MRPISDMSIIVIDVTNACDRACSNCTRLIGNQTADRIYYMEPAYFEKALTSLHDYPGIVGMIGGEPTLHPEFSQLCEIMQEHISEKGRRGLWSNKGGKFQEYGSIIAETFGYFNLNDHIAEKIMHAPVLVSSGDIVKSGLMSQAEADNYIDNCWIQMKWSATINIRGAYFCEVAASLALLFDGPPGWDIEKEPDWWKKAVPEYLEQREWACEKCGCAIPLTPRRSTEGIDDVSNSNLERLVAVKSPKIKKGRVNISLGQVDTKQPRNASWYFNRKGYY